MVTARLALPAFAKLKSAATILVELNGEPALEAATLVRATRPDPVSLQMSSVLNPDSVLGNSISAVVFDINIAALSTLAVASDFVPFKNGSRPTG